MTAPKLVFFDMEGTLFLKAEDYGRGNTAPSAWGMISKHLGSKASAEEMKTRVKWTSGGYHGYVEWMEDTIRIYQKYGLDRKFFASVLESIEYHDGVAEVFAALRKRGIKTALVSGGFKAQADKAAVDLKIDHVFAACEFYWDEKGKLAWWNLLPCDYEGKADFMKLIMHEHGLKPGECAFVGDGKNDIALAKAVGLSIAFNGDPALQKACTHAINQSAGREDFRALLPLLGL
jgi:phosphoserine phosphatase